MAAGNSKRGLTGIPGLLALIAILLSTALFLRLRWDGAEGRRLLRDVSFLASSLTPKASRESMRVMKRKPNQNRTAAAGMDFDNPIPMIKCANQTSCIQPFLQLKREFRVYFCKHVGHGVRFYYLVREGLLLHPLITLVSSPEEAEVVVYLPVSADWGKSECTNKAYLHKMVVLDEGDGPDLFRVDEGNFQLMFKRSYVRRRNGVFSGYMNYLERLDVLPMSYTIMEAYVRTEFNRIANRDLELLCTLRGSKADPVRLRVRQWAQEYAVARGLKKYSAGEVNSASRTIVSKNYMQQMYRSQLIVTSNPSNWEGDFRLCEAIASGALIFVDQMYVPRPYPLLSNRHFVVYDNNNKTDLFEKLDFYRGNKESARRVALNGYLHSMRFHRAANLIDYVFRTLHTQQSVQHSLKGEEFQRTAFELGYTDVGYDMRSHAIAISNALAAKKITKKKKE